MPTIVTFYPNGEYIQGHIPLRPRHTKEVVVDLSDSGVMASLREGISAPTDAPPRPRYADLQPWERPGTKYFGLNATIWWIMSVEWDSYVFAVKQVSGDVCKRKVQGRGVSALLKYHLEPALPEYNRAFAVSCDEYIPAASLLSEFSPDLGSSSVEILARSKTRKKCERLTKRMARNIRNGCYLMEQRYGQQSLSFLTLTVPALSDSAYAMVCQQWGQLVNKFTKWLRKETLLREGYEQEYVYCTEIQEKRRKRTGKIAPHLHMVFRGRSSRGARWTFTPLEIRAEWTRLLHDCVGEAFETRALENVQQIKKSAGGYLAKYLGKGVESSECPDLRTHWGGMSRNLCKLIRQCCTVWRSDGEYREYLYSFLGAQERLVKAGLVKTYRRFWIDLEGGVRVRDSRDGEEHNGAGFYVGSGVLSVSTYCGGVVKVLLYLQYIEECSLCSIG